MNRSIFSVKFVFFDFPRHHPSFLDSVTWRGAAHRGAEHYATVGGRHDFLGDAEDGVGVAAGRVAAAGTAAQGRENDKALQLQMSKL